jgi:hypothetical protein
MIGDSVRIANDTTAEVLSPGPAGANQNWNFSTLTNGGIDTVLFIAPNQTPFSSEFPAANLAIQVGTVFAYNNMDTTGADTVLEQGFAGQIDVAGFSLTAVVPFTPNPIAALLPGNFGDNWTSNYQFEVVLEVAALGLPIALPGVDSIRLKRMAQRFDTLDAWGSLIIPNDTIAQTLRLKRRENLVDSIFTIGASAGCGVFIEFIPGVPIEVVPCATPSTEFTYQWWAPNRKSPVLSFTVDEADTVGGFSGVQYQYREPAQDTSNRLGEETGIAALQVYPVPAQATLVVEYQLQSAQPVDVRLTDALGRIVLQQNHLQPAGAQRLELPTAELPTGAYWLLLRTSNGTEARRFVK